MVKATAAGTPDQETKALDKPTRAEIFEAMLLVARSTNLVPTAIGPTAAGKTFGFNELAIENNAEVVTVLLGQHTPDEIAGFQLAINDQLVIQMPFWFKEAQAILDRGKNAWILFDELGLAREETRGALYTFMRDRHLHGYSLSTPPGAESLVFAASNPASFAPPFKSRCLFFSIPADREYLLNIAAGYDFATRVASLAVISNEEDPFYSNAAPPEPVVINAASIAALRQITPKPEFWQLSEPARYAILSGLIPHQTLASVLKDSTINVLALAKDYKELLRALKTLPKDQMHQLINNILESFPQVTPKKRGDAILSILEALYADLTGDDLNTYFSTPHSDSVVQAVVAIDKDFLELRLKERKLLWVETKGNNNTPKGYFLDQLRQIVAANVDASDQTTP